MSHASFRDAGRRHLLLYSASVALLGALACKKSPPATCPPGNLTPDEINVRNTLGYTDRTPEPGKPCVKCIQYVAAPAADQCGTCKVMKGAIHPNGYCRAFVAIT